MNYDSALSFLRETEDIGRDLARRVLDACRRGLPHFSRFGWTLVFEGGKYRRVV